MMRRPTSAGCSLPWTSMILSVVLFGAGAGSASAQDPSRRDGEFVIHDFRFQSGDVLPELRLAYVTLGTQRRDAGGRVTNAVLMLHGTTSSAEGVLNTYYSELFAAGQPLDARDYYIILPDSIGHGNTTRPSNGLRGRFPRYGYNDMVDAQYRLVTEALGVSRLRLVTGVSMGGMHTWLWGGKYPDMMDALMPITSHPTPVSGLNYIWRRVMTDAIRGDPDWKGGMYETQPTRWHSAAPLLFGMADSSLRLQRIAPTNAESQKLYDDMLERARKAFGDANDFLYAFEASWDYNPTPYIGRIKARLLALNFADDVINPAEIGAVEAAVANIPGARSILMPPSATSMGHLSQNQPAIWKHHLAEFLRLLP